MKKSLKYVLFGVVELLLLCAVAFGAVKLTSAKPSGHTVEVTSEYGTTTYAPIGIAADKFIKNMEKAGYVGKTSISKDSGDDSVRSEEMRFYTCEYENGMKLELETDKRGNVYDVYISYSSDIDDGKIHEAFVKAYNKSIPKDILDKISLSLTDNEYYTYRSNNIQYYAFGVGSLNHISICSDVEHVS